MMRVSKVARKKPRCWNTGAFRVHDVHFCLSLCNHIIPHINSQCK